MRRIIARSSTENNGKNKKGILSGTGFFFLLGKLKTCPFKDLLIMKAFVIKRKPNRRNNNSISTGKTRTINLH